MAHRLRRRCAGLIDEHLADFAAADGQEVVRSSQPNDAAEHACVDTDRLPARGPALIVANHVTFIDWLFLAVLCRRPVRFVMHHRYYRLPVLGWICRLAGAIPIAGRHEDQRVLDAALDTIDAALAAGEAVVFFPERSLTRDGEVASFRPGVDWILARRPVPVVPVALRGLWGSRFSRARERADRRWFRPTLEVVCGAAVPAPQASRDALFAHVTALRGVHR